nr:MAG TPA: hypothetical protein [Caudoviricetes sp.]
MRLRQRGGIKMENIARNLANSVLSWLLCRRSVLGRDRRETAERCDGDALDGVSDGVR